MRWCALGVAALVGCGPRIGTDDGRLSGQGSAGSDGEAGEGSSGVAMPDDDDGGSSGLEDDACPASDPNVAFELTVEFAGDGLPSEGGGLERNASCTIVGTSGGPGHAELELACDEESGGSSVAYHIAVLNENDPFSSWIDLEETIDLQYEKWFGFESGGGQSLALSQDGYMHLVAHDASAGGGLVGICATSQGTARIAAEEWMWKFDAMLNERRCAEGTLFRLNVPTRDGGSSVFPGMQGVIEDLSYVYSEGGCSFTEGGPEDWSFSVLLWR